MKRTKPVDPERLDAAKGCAMMFIIGVIIMLFVVRAAYGIVYEERLIQLEIGGDK